MTKRAPLIVLNILLLAVLGCGSRAVRYDPSADGDNPFITRPTEGKSTNGQGGVQIADLEITPSATPTRRPTNTPPPSDTPTPRPNGRDEAIGRNEDWLPVIEEFNGVQMALVPIGCFEMGTEAGDIDAQPAHTQCIDAPFWIDLYEVTDEDYYGFAGDREPADQITWGAATDHCNQRGARLPTEREWEYAARGPSGWTYTWGNEFDYSMGALSGSDRTTVGRWPDGASWVGAQDMIGNLWEWTSSLMMPYPYDQGDGRESSFAGGKRVKRGGSYAVTELKYFDATWRSSSNPSPGYRGMGFRCARDD